VWADEAGFQLVAPPPEGWGDGWGDIEGDISTGPLLGDLPRRRVETGTSSGLVEFVIPDVELTRRPAGIYHFRWRWCLQGKDGVLHFATTSHRLYLVHEEPGEPWLSVDDILEELSRPFRDRPWTRALDLALGWGGGTTSPPRSAGRIARAFHHHASRRRAFEGLTYDPSTSFYSLRSGLHLEALLDALDGLQSRGARVNCNDCALAVCVLANLVGGRLRRLTIADTGAWEQPRRKELYCNPVLGMGWGEFRAVNVGMTFLHHVVACIPGGEQEPDNPPVLDAALKLAARADPTPIIPQRPAESYAPAGLRTYLGALAIGPRGIPGWTIDPTYAWEPQGLEWPQLDLDEVGELGLLRSLRLAELDPDETAAILTELVDRDGSGAFLRALLRGWQPWSVARHHLADLDVVECVLHRRSAAARPGDDTAGVLQVRVWTGRQLQKSAGGADPTPLLRRWVAAPPRRVSPDWLESDDRRGVLLASRADIVELSYDGAVPTGDLDILLGRERFGLR